MRYILLPLLVFALPLDIQAAEGLVSCAGGDECGFCELIILVNTLVEWIVTVVTTLVILLFAFAGFRLITAGGDASALQDAKKYLINAIIGILIILAGWTIVDTGLKLVAGGDLGVWNATDCQYARPAGKPGDFIIPLTKNEIEQLVLFDEYTVNSFSSDHGIVTSGVPISGSGGNCPGASASQVVRIPGESNKYLRADAASNFIAMRSAAAADGITLRLTSAWRSQASQDEIWARKNCDVVGCSGRVARPCSKGGSGSNHNGGVAVDISGSLRGSAIYNWLKANGGRYGFNNNLGPSDPVHWSPSGK